jgi:UPF0755 protein
VKRVFVPLVFAVVFAAGGAAALFYAHVHEPYRGYSDSEQYVDISQGAGTRTIGRQLVAAGVVRDVATYRLALWLTGDARRLKAGEYRFDRPLTPIAVVEKIARGEVDYVPVTFPEGLTIPEMGNILELQGLATREAFTAAARETSAIQPVDSKAADLEGYLFPDTYLVSHRQTAPRLVKMMIQQFEKETTADLRAAVHERRLSIREWVTLASMVEKETARPDERPLVAAVYENRLRIGMGLQCDPTVIYALEREGKYTGNLGHDDLAFDSPYNTYKYRGLPPGPIASPGKESLQAVAHPAEVPFLYFVSRNDGSHEFAKTLDEHNRNVRRFQGAGRAEKTGRTANTGRTGEAGDPGRGK